MVTSGAEPDEVGEGDRGRRDTETGKAGAGARDRRGRDTGTGKRRGGKRSRPHPSVKRVGKRPQSIIIPAGPHSPPKLATIPTTAALPAKPEAQDSMSHD